MSMSISSNALQVAASFAAADKATFAKVVAVTEQTTVDVRDQWRTNATATAGKHGKHYPKSIQHKMVPSLTAIVGEVEPDASMPQGGMSFEYGSVNQPPHLDGQRAAQQYEEVFGRRLNAVLVF